MTPKPYIYNESIRVEINRLREGIFGDDLLGQS